MLLDVLQKLHEVLPLLVHEKEFGRQYLFILNVVYELYRFLVQPEYAIKVDLIFQRFRFPQKLLLLAAYSLSPPSLSLFLLRMVCISSNQKHWVFQHCGLQFHVFQNVSFYQVVDHHGIYDAIQ